MLVDSSIQDVDIPESIAALERDARGYPVPFIVLHDAEGKPMFAANDANKVALCHQDKLCHICGQELEPNPWFVGGPGSFLLNQDRCVYFDGPMHRECLHFALRVCPHLAQLMSGTIGDAVIARLRRQGIHAWNTTVVPGVPQIFIAVQAWKYERKTTFQGTYFHVQKPTLKVEYWQRGEMMPRQEGEKLAKRAARELAQKGRIDGA